MPNTKTVVPFRGTKEQEAKLHEVIAKHKNQPGATMPVLQEVQAIYGYLPEEVQIMVAEGLGIPLTEVYGHCFFLFSVCPEPQRRISSVCLYGHRLLC